MNTVVKSHVIAQLEELPVDKLERLADALGVTDTDNLDLLGERLEQDVLTASLHGISVKQKRGIVDYINTKMRDLKPTKLRKIVSSYFSENEVRLSEHSNSLVLINIDGKEEARGICYFLESNLKRLESDKLAEIITKYFATWDNVELDPNNNDVVIVE